MIDLHCHVDLLPKPKDAVQVLLKNDVTVLSVTTTPSAWPGTSALAQGIPTIETALGLHPQLAEQRRSELSTFDRLLPQVRWVGEIGLDGSPELRSSWATQVKIFEHILRSCSSAGGRLMSIHSRRAASPVTECLRQYPDSGVAVLHWFSGTNRELDVAIDGGCWFSVGPPMLMSKKGRDLASKIPRTRLLTETDAPFAEFNGKPLNPWDVVIAERLLAEIWGMSQGETRNLIRDNFRQLQTKIGKRT